MNDFWVAEDLSMERKIMETYNRSYGNWFGYSRPRFVSLFGSYMWRRIMECYDNQR